MLRSKQGRKYRVVASALLSLENACRLEPLVCALRTELAELKELIKGTPGSKEGAPGLRDHGGKD